MMYSILYYHIPYIDMLPTPDIETKQSHQSCGSYDKLIYADGRETRGNCIIISTFLQEFISLGSRSEVEKRKGKKPHNKGKGSLRQNVK